MLWRHYSRSSVILKATLSSHFFYIKIMYFLEFNVVINFSLILENIDYFPSSSDPIKTISLSRSFSIAGAKHKRDKPQHKLPQFSYRSLASL